MFDYGTYHPDDEIPSPATEAMNQLLNSPSSTPTPPGIKTSNGSSSNSPLQDLTSEGIFPLSTMPLPLDDPEFLQDYLGSTFPEIAISNPSSEDYNQIDLFSNFTFEYIMPEELPDDRLRMIAEPQALYRERYSCETDPNKNRAHRFIRTGNKNGYEYPTVQFSSNFCDPTRELYIQVTPVTIKSGNVPHHCIHPYRINADENDIIKDNDNNSLYFRIHSEEFSNCQKRFLISRTKMIQNELTSYGPLRIYGTNQFDNQRTLNSRKAKQIIATYELWKSQLMFVIAERHDPQSLPVPLMHTAVTSQIMTDAEIGERQSTTNQSNHNLMTQIKSVPQKIDRKGNEEILVIMPQPIKQKVYSLSFDFGQHGSTIVTHVTHIDQKTFAFIAPECPLSFGDQNTTIPIIIKENNIDIGVINLTYVTTMRVTINVCPSCQQNTIIKNALPSSKRPRELYEFREGDNVGNSLATQMKELIIGPRQIEPSSSSSSLSTISSSSTLKSTTDAVDGSSKIDKYLNQLQEALAIFVKTNDPSVLFRRTRVLLSKCEDSSPPLHVAIERGHIPLALTVIEQVASMREKNNILDKRNENEETVLLVGARCNEWKVIELIVKKRQDTILAKDKDGNNILHILGSVKDDAGAETIKKLFEILPTDVKVRLLNESNENNESAQDIAQSQGNTECARLLNKTN